MSFAILIFPQVEELDFVGPWEMLTTWQRIAAGPDCLLVAESMAPIACAKGLSVNPQVTFEDCPALNYLLVPGGQGTRSQVTNSNLLDFVATRGKTCTAILSVCTGAFVLHAAGLLAGRKATTHWGSLERLRALADVTVVEERFVQDGHIWTSAGISAGLDATLAFIAWHAGEETAAKVQFATEYYPSGQRHGSLHNTHPSAPAYARDGSRIRNDHR